MLRSALFILTTLTALAIGASGPATAAKHSSSDVQSKAEAEITATKKLLESRENKSKTTTTETPATVAPPAPPNVGTTPNNRSSASTTDSTAALNKIQQYFMRHRTRASASATLPKGTQLNVGAQVPTGVRLFPMPHDLMTHGTSHYAYFVSGNSVVVVDSKSKTIAGVFPTHD